MSLIRKLRGVCRVWGKELILVAVATLVVSSAFAFWILVLRR